MGKILVVEATDGSGKDVQTEKLIERLTSTYGERNVYKQSFPNYNNKKTSSLAVMYLDGEFGDNPNVVTPKVASLFYACDRFGTFNSYGDNLFEKTGCRNLTEFYNQENTILILDRYTSSNIVHQCSKLDDNELKLELADWMQQTEFGLFSLPKPDITLYLNVSLESSLELIKHRKNKIDSTDTKDIHEKNVDFQRRSKETGLLMAKELNWDIVECNNKDGSLKSIEEISELIYNKLKEKEIIQ